MGEKYGSMDTICNYRIHWRNREIHNFVGHGIVFTLIHMTPWPHGTCCDEVEGLAQPLESGPFGDIYGR